MQGKSTMKLSLLSGFLLLAVCTSCHAGGPVREPAVAGQFYPADSTELRLAVNRYLGEALPRRAGKPLAIIVPHAGYVFAGQIIADAFKQVEGQSYDLIVVLGTNHTTAGFHGVSVYPKGSFKTPLGEVAVDEDAADALLKADQDCVDDPRLHEKEHSVEVELPFVQTLFPRVPILPMVIGDPDLEMCTRLGNALVQVTRGLKVLIVASSDLTHYPKYSDARRVDAETLKAVATLDAAAVVAVSDKEMAAHVPALVTCACGEGPILTAIVAAKELGAEGGAVISYANSGDASLGDPGRVVGYGAVALTANASVDTSALQWQESDSTATLSRDDEKALLAFARKSIEWYATSETAPFPRGYSAGAMLREGVFVTLSENGELRGCIGHMEGNLPLCHVVGNMAIAAAFEDRRFSPVRTDELGKITIEISVLTPMKRISDAGKIRVGTDGVFMRKGDHSAVFLPQVATEQKWSREQMLGYLSLKADLPEDAWKEGAEFSTFQAIVFSENDF